MLENIVKKKNLPPQVEDFEGHGIHTLDQGIQMSIAVSLKRIADILTEAWENEKKASQTQTLNGRNSP